MTADLTNATAALAAIEALADSLSETDRPLCEAHIWESYGFTSLATAARLRHQQLLETRAAAEAVPVGPPPIDIDDLTARVAARIAMALAREFGDVRYLTDPS